jgi:DNA-binding response OmpR family regulator
MTSVLIVDDDDQVRRSLARLLSRHELVCRTVATGEAALAAVSAEPPDVVLLDVGLGHESGLDLLRELRSADPRRPAVVMVTSRRDLFPEISTELGTADDWVTKPWDAEELVARVYLAKRRSAANRSV